MDKYFIWRDAWSDEWKLSHYRNGQRLGLWIGFSNRLAALTVLRRRINSIAREANK